MKTVICKLPEAAKRSKILHDYDIAADAKNRVSLRGAKTKYFHVKALANGCYLLEPRILVAPSTVPAAAQKVTKSSATGLRKASTAKAPKAKLLSLENLPALASGESFYEQALPILKQAWARRGRGQSDLATNPKYLEGFGE